MPWMNFFCMLQPLGIPPSVTLSHKVSSFLDIHHRAPPRSRHIKLEERKKQLGGFRVKFEIRKLLEICGYNSRLQFLCEKQMGKFNTITFLYHSSLSKLAKAKLKTK